MEPRENPCPLCLYPVPLPRPLRLKGDASLPGYPKPFALRQACFALLSSPRSGLQAVAVLPVPQSSRPPLHVAPINIAPLPSRLVANNHCAAAAAAGSCGCARGYATAHPLPAPQSSSPPLHNAALPSLSQGTCQTTIVLLQPVATAMAVPVAMPVKSASALPPPLPPPASQ